MAAVFADSRFDVIGYDSDPAKNSAVNAGRAPIFESGLNELIARNKERFRAASNASEAVLDSDITFIVVPTPSAQSGLFSTELVVRAARSIGMELRKKSGYHVVVLTSTVLPGASRAEVIPALEQSSAKVCGADFGFCYSPEFIALGSVLKNLIEPDYFLIGEFDARSGDALEHVNRRVAVKAPQFSRLTIEEAELAKIATNTYVTMKISFANYLSDICGRLLNSNIDNVTAAVGLDSRIGPKYLSGGLGFGGPCFPRDNVALARFAEGLGVDSSIPLAVDRFNRGYAGSVASVVTRAVSAAARVGVVGLTYKPDSHVLEESPSLAIIEALKKAGHRVMAYDALRERFEPGALPASIELTGTLEQLVDVSDAVVLTHRDVRLAQTVLHLVKTSGRSIAIVDCWRMLSESLCAGLRVVRLGATPPS